MTDVNGDMGTGPDDLGEVDDTPDDPSWAGRIDAHIDHTHKVDEHTIIVSEN
ncbi:hypothetical protein [Mycobacterium sp.]|uniref:hypothetical protein n=1 Tax=Mycobacterium sp. TaxID=1785 RepID=UPI003F9D1ACA